MRFAEGTTSKTPLIYLSLMLAAILVITGCGGSSDDKQDSRPSSSVIPSESSSSTAGGAEITLDSGGSISVPAGALPEGAQINSKPTQTPVLPDDVKAVGEALAISATAALAQPVTLRFPIPEVASNPENLVVIRVESDGTTTFLMTEVEEDELVAVTPGFSTFIIGDLMQNNRNLVVSGKPELVPGEQTTYRMDLGNHVSTISGATWKVTGNASLVFSGDVAAVVEAGEEEGYAGISYEFIDLLKGWRWYGYKYVRIRPNSRDPFTVGVTTRTPIIGLSDEVIVSAAVYGEFELPITWSWDFGDGEKGGPTTTGAKATKFGLPTKIYKDPKNYHVKVTAVDHQGRSESGDVMVRVIREALSVIIEGQQRLEWYDPGLIEPYVAKTAGGKLPYRNIWLLSPGGEPRNVTEFSITEGVATSTELITFYEPGEYLLKVDASDNKEGTATAILPIIVEADEALHTHMLDLPAKAKPNERVSFSIQVRGGVMVTSGKKTGYTLTIDWGDDSKLQVEKDVGLKRTPYEGTVVPVFHTYTEAKTYPVRVEVFDATGSSDNDTRNIEITEATPEASPEAGLKRFVLAETILSDLPEQPITWRDQYGNHSGTATLTDWEIVWDVRTAGAGGTDAGVSILKVYFGGLPSEVVQDQKIETTATWNMTVSGDKPRYTTGVIELYGGDRFRQLKRLDVEQEPTGTSTMEWYLTKNSGEFIIKAKVLVYDRYVTIEWIYRPSEA
ncbi:MAG: PKD domain-containing protein [Dehalococcoidia bacterium]|nr:PKD domain-containing protein [Dehalococcoidia bacterium]